MYFKEQDFTYKKNMYFFKNQQYTQNIFSFESDYIHSVTCYFGNQNKTERFIQGCTDTDNGLTQGRTRTHPKGADTDKH